MSLEQELLLQREMYPDGPYSLRLWVVGSPEAKTYCNVDWCLSRYDGITSHTTKLGRFTWNGHLDVPMRAIIAAREAISSVYDKLPPI